MAAPADRVPGIAIEVDELIAVRATLTGVNAARLRQRNRKQAGSREIRLRGRGMEYAESRAYVYGDDMRTMDWRVMARTGEAHTKLFAEEKDRCTLVAVDLSPSMYFGTRVAFKSWAAAQVAAHVGWLAVLVGERVGGLVVSATHHAEVRPGKIRSGLLNLFHHLARADRGPLSTGGDHRLERLLGELRRVAAPDTDIALISDFMGLGDSAYSDLAALTRTNRVFLHWIHDRSEVEPWLRGPYPLYDAAGEYRWLDLDDAVQRRQLEQRQRRHRERVEALATTFNLPLTPVCCNQDITAQLLPSPLTRP